MADYVESDNEGNGHSCCAVWHRDAETIAAEYIKKRAKTNCLSRFVCCDNLRCFDRHNLLCLYIFVGIAVFILFFATICYAFIVYHPAVYTQHFRETECKIDSIVYNENFTSSCTWSRDEESGTNYYMCLRVYVSYVLRGDQYQEKNVADYSTLYHDTYVDMTDSYPLTCSVQPNSCDRGEDIDAKIEVYYNNFAYNIRNTTFPCFYNPDNLKEVIGVEELDVGTARGYLTLIAGLLTGVGLLLIFMCCTCGCQYICCSSTNIPQEIEEAMANRRSTEMQSLTVVAPAAGATGGRDPVVYVGKPVQVVPVIQGTGQFNSVAPQPPPMQPHLPPTAPQYGQYPPPGMQASPGNYPQQPGTYPAPQPGYPAPQPGYPPPQPGAYQPGPYAPGPQPQPGEQPPPYDSLNHPTAPELPAKPPME